MRDKKYLEELVWKNMKSKTIRHPVFGEVIYDSLAAIYDILEETRRHYILYAYVRRSRDGFDENIVHIQMNFKDGNERDMLWDKASEKMVMNIEKGIEKSTDPEEKLEIENILCAVRSEK